MFNQRDLRIRSDHILKKYPYLTTSILKNTNDLKLKLRFSLCWAFNYTDLSFY